MSIINMSNFKSKYASLPDFYRSLILAIVLSFPVFFIYFFALGSVTDKATFILNDTLILVLMYFVAALSLDLEVGSLGLPNFGKVGFIALGAYITTIIMNLGLFGNFLVDYAFGFVLACIVSAIFGWLIAIPSVKLRADYFAIMTIAGGEIIRLVLQNEKRYFWKLTDPVLNIKEPLLLNTFKQNLSNLQIFGIIFSDVLTLNLGSFTLGFGDTILYTLDLNFGGIFIWQFFVFLLFLAIAIIIYLFVEVIRKSPYGRTLRAIREDDITVTSVGKDVYTYRWQIAVIAAIICSIAGSLFCILNSAFEPIDFRPYITFNLFVFIIVGGIGNSRGVAFGTLLIQMFIVSSTSEIVKANLNIKLSEILPVIGPIMQDFQIKMDLSADYTRFVILGVILIIFLLYRSEGIIPEPKSNNERYLSLLTEDERKDSDLAVQQMQSSSEKDRIQSQFAEKETIDEV